MNSSVVFSVRTSAFDVVLHFAALHAQALDLALHLVEARLRLLQQQVGAALGFADDDAGFVLRLFLDVVRAASGR